MNDILAVKSSALPPLPPSLSTADAPLYPPFPLYPPADPQPLGTPVTIDDPLMNWPTSGPFSLEGVGFGLVGTELEPGVQLGL